MTDKGTDDLWREITDAVLKHEQSKFDRELKRLTRPDGMIERDLAQSLILAFTQRVTQRMWPIAERVFVDPLPKAAREEARARIRKEMLGGIELVAAELRKRMP